VDDQDRITYYDGTQKVIDSAGTVVGTFTGKEYLDFISERVQPWTYLKFPYQKKLGAWKGIVEGPGTNIYAVGPLARMNVAKGMDTPKAQQHFEQFHATFGARPVHHILAYHWARAIELLNAAEKCLQLSRDPEITSKDTWDKPTSCPGEGVGIIEAPRGTLIHHYETDKRGIITRANMIVATQNNAARIAMSVDRAARALIHEGKADDTVLNMIEMAFRAYDPCHGCATHALPGSMPLWVNVYDAAHRLVRTIRRDRGTADA
jgi:F420-non-reducing hydrogenase large subunit